MRRTVAVVGAGPAGLMAAERLAAAGHAVTVYERMASPARKLLMAGRGGLNLTHTEPADRFATRYGPAAEPLAPALAAFTAADLRAWADGLGAETFVGSSGRVFPRAMKASPLVRAWLRRLDGLGVRLLTGHHWQGFTADGALVFARNAGAPVDIAADATILALGGASWPRLGSTGAWVPVLAADGVAISPLAASNCGVRIAWSAPMQRHAGAPLKRIAVTCAGTTVRGEAVITRTGLEGGAVYALGPTLRAEIGRTGAARLAVDLRPGMTVAEVAAKLAAPRGKQSMATYLKKRLALPAQAITLLREGGPLTAEPHALAAQIKAVAMTASGLDGLERAISTAGGVHFDALDGHGMLTHRPGVFIVGEMLDWDAPTGGYLLQATLATAVWAAAGADGWLAARQAREQTKAAETGAI